MSTPITDRQAAPCPLPPMKCDVTPLLDVAFSRWSARVLWQLHCFGRQRFVELERRLGTITPKVLTQRLRQLERDGLVTRTYHPEVPPRVEYEITELGNTLGPLFAAMSVWSSEHLADVEAARLAFDAHE